MTTAKQPKQKPESRTDTEPTPSERQIDYSEIPKADASWYERAEFVQPGYKTLKARLDRDVVDWYKAQWPKFRTRMNQVLRSHMEKNLKPFAPFNADVEKVMVVGKFDPEVITWLKSGHEDYETIMSRVLRDFMDWYKEKGFDKEPD